MNEKTELRRQISAVAFTLFDLRLFLDTQPNDQTAIQLFNKNLAKHTALVADYERRFGPYSTFNDTTGNTWQWVKDPWPWEYTAEV